MAPFNSEYQLSHDIDWFAKAGNKCIHAMSFGGILPNDVDDRERNTEILIEVYHTDPEYKNLVINEGYLSQRLGQADNEKIYQRKRERYLRHFIEMASRGFWSFDRDLDQDNVYHLIVKPKENNYRMRIINKLPELREITLMTNSDDDWVLRG